MAIPSTSATGILPPPRPSGTRWVSRALGSITDIDRTPRGQPLELEEPMSQLWPDIKVVDADTHLTEAHDLWTKRAPAAYKDRVPHVTEVDGRPTWVVDGAAIGFAGGGGVIDRDGDKFAFSESMTVWGIDRVHEAAYNPDVR